MLGLVLLVFVVAGDNSSSMDLGIGSDVIHTFLPRHGLVRRGRLGTKQPDDFIRLRRLLTKGSDFTV